MERKKEFLSTTPVSYRNGGVVLLLLYLPILLNITRTNHIIYLLTLWTQEIIIVLQSSILRRALNLI